MRILDVSRRVRGVSFCYQTDAEIAALRVADITQSAAYDDLGRAIPGGLYDPRLGPIAWSDGNCVTCGLTYGTCPGHFGRIALPFPLVHPSLTPRLVKVLRAACWHCGRLRVVGRKKTLLLARLRFVHAAEDESAQFVKVYVFSSLAGAAGRGKGISADAYADEVSCEQLLADKVLQGAPAWLREGLDAMEHGERTEKVVDGIVAAAAEEAWKKAESEGRLVETPEGSVEWDECVRSLIVSDGPTKCPCCMETGKKITKGPTGTFFFPGKSAASAPSAVIGTIQLAQQLGKVWGLERDIFELVFGLKGRAVRRGSPPLDHEMFFVRNVLVPPSRSRPAAAMVETGLSAEHQQNVFYQRLLTSLDKMLDLKAKAAAAKEGDGESGDSGDEGESVGGGGGNDSPPAVVAEAEDDAQSEFASVGKAGKSHEYMRIVAEMQKTMNDLYDSPGGDVRVNGGAMGIRQQLETKQGLFRMHMMGKRVNFSCRSVIGPDVFLDTNEVGIPESFAKKLTIAEPVTPLNVAKMQQAVLNGPDVYPGANAVEDWNRSGQLKTVVLRSPANRRQLETQAKLLVRTTRDVGDVGIGVGKANGHGEGERNGEAGHHSFSAPAEDGAVLPKRVLRHLKTGDVVLFNRQPTLHRVSIMAHKVRVLPGDKTIRFHYSNCGSYNADFDGDEMNVHVPQDDIARAEAYELMLSDQHYIAPTSGEPIRNLIQDHILAAALISKRGSFFGREEFSALLYGATERVMCGSVVDGEQRFSLPTPAILKPQRMWTGKQLISAVLRTISRERTGISVTGDSKVSAHLVGREETQVLFRKGEHLRGVLDKASFGASKFGIVHAVQEAYGAHAAGNFLSAIGRLCTLFIRRHGHTTGVDDLLLVALSESKRLKELTSAVGTIGADAAKDVHKSFAAEDRADGYYGGKSDAEMKDDGAGSAESTFEEARILVSDIVQRKGAIAETRLDAAMMTKLNSLSSVVNTCVPKGLVKKFPRNGFSLMTDTGAKGGAVNSRQISCLLGSTIMEGKRVPRMGGSGSTLPCFAPYDPSPNAGGFIASRFLTGMAPYEMFFHAMAGREGLLDTSLKTANSGYLQRCLVKHLEGIRLHYDYTARDANGMVIQMLYGDDGIDPCKASWLMGNLPWLLENRDALAGANLDQLNDGAGKCMKPSKAVRSLQKKCRKKCRNSGSTLLEAASPGSLAKFGVVSEKFQAKIEAAQSHLLDRQARSHAEAFCWRRYQKAAAEPGEGVGIIAAHSVGEPSTQMTLNTFHHAGSESKHVTLGVPRLRELLMTASKYPKTPTMTMPLLDGLGEGSARELSQMFADVSLLDLLEKVVVQEGGVSFDGGEFAIHKLTVTLEFPDEKVYSKDLGFGFSRILEVMNGKKTNFKANLMKHFSKELKKLSLDERECLVRIDPNEIDDYTTGISVPQPVPDVESGAKSGSQKEQEALVEAGDSDDDVAGAVKEDSDDDAPDSDMDEHESEDGDAGEIGGTSEEKSEAKSKIIVKAKSKTRQRSTSVVRKVTATASDAADGDDSLALPKSGGYVLLTADKSGRKVMIPIELPREVTGRLRVAEIVREAASGLKLASVDRITRCFTEKEGKDGKPSKALNVSTEGSNLTAVLELGDGLVDMNSISTNDMYGILNTYGVEALRAALVEEFKTIFGAYGIPVDVRHLSVIADYQCALGGYRSFSRLTMNTAASTMQQFSFETTMKFLTEAALSGRPDPVMTAPSAAVAFGEIYSGGTGSFEVLSQVK